MKEHVNRLFRFLSPKGKENREGFLIIFLCAVASVLLISWVSGNLRYLNDTDSYLNLYIYIYYCIGIVGLLSGIVPFNILLLAYCTYGSIHLAYEVGYWFFMEAIVVDVLYVLYVIQCIRRCHDIGRGWKSSFIPLFNPWVLVFKKGGDAKEKYCETSKSAPQEGSSMNLKKYISFNKRRCGRLEFVLTFMLFAFVCYLWDSTSNYIGYLMVIVSFGSLSILSILGFQYVWDMKFEVDSLIMSILLLIYIVQGIRRCRDMGVSPWRMFIPLYMPIALLVKKGKYIESQ
jgi:uncharacterized membrane protein YhaH (DUF805 family)